MRNLLLPILISSFITIGGCTNSATNDKKDKVQNVQALNITRYKLFPTQNMWTFIKLDTKTGRLWQVQYSISNDKERFEYDLNTTPLVSTDKELNGRFELYPTTNIYNFILLDKIDGQQWQVQWSFEKENRAIIPIN